jgi:hypothetical protein
MLAGTQEAGDRPAKSGIYIRHKIGKRVREVNQDMAVLASGNGMLAVGISPGIVLLYRSGPEQVEHLETITLPEDYDLLGHGMNNLAIDENHVYVYAQVGLPRPRQIRPGGQMVEDPEPDAAVFAYDLHWKKNGRDVDNPVFVQRRLGRAHTRAVTKMESFGNFLLLQLTAAQDKKESNPQPMKPGTPQGAPSFDWVYNIDKLYVVDTTTGKLVLALETPNGTPQGSQSLVKEQMPRRMEMQYANGHFWGIGTDGGVLFRAGE